MSTILKAPKRVQKMDNIIFVDTESELKVGDNKKTYHQCYLICAKMLHRLTFKNTYKNKKFCNYTLDSKGERNIIEKFWLWVIEQNRKYKKLYIIAHNAKYDSLILHTLDAFKQYGYNIENFSFSQPFFITAKYLNKLTGDTHEITFFSSTNIFQASIKKLGKLLNMDKIEYDYYSQGINWSKAVTYCRRDVDILYYTYLHYFDVLNLIGNMSDKITVASQSLEIYKRFFLPHNDIEIHRIKELHKLERFGYKGGRCECFRIGKFKNIYSFDINSMYPYIMKKKMLPYKLKYTRPTMTVKELENYIVDDKYYIYAECYISTNRRCFSKLYNKRLCFPVGEFWDFLHHDEIKSGLEHGEIKRVFNISIYEKANLFDKYVDYFYTARRTYKANGNDIYAYLFKLFLNSLYGKFGQKKIETISEKVETDFTGNMIEITEENGEKIYKNWLYFNGNRYYTKTVGEAYSAFPIIAGAITAGARMLLYKYIEICGIENMYYCDTDSLFTNEKGKKALEKAEALSETELGKMKLEKFCDTLEIRNCKDYTYTEKKQEHIKRKGINVYSDQTEKITENEYNINYWSGYRDILKSKENKYFTEIRKKVYNTEYKKGILEKNYVKPYIIHEDKNFYKKDYKY